jgi:oxygen-independent coproporphyrinogen-3 oxidase
VREKLDFSQVKEFTVEAGRADSITREKLEVLKKYGVTRISVNPQTMNDETLKLIGRRHTVNQVRTSFNLAREVGFDNINMDIILGLPSETESDVQYTIDEIIKLNPDSLTVHSLAIKRASRLNQWIEENGISTLKNTDTTMKIAQTGATRLDMKPYYLYRQKNMSGNFENVGYARDGKYGIYNILIMEECQSIVALGAGSITKRVFPDGRIERCDNVKDVALYIERIDEMIERKRQLLA